MDVRLLVMLGVASCAQATPTSTSHLDLSIAKDASGSFDLDDDQGTGGDQQSCDVDAAGALLFVAATTTSGAPFAARYDIGGWTSVAVGGSGDVAAVATSLQGREAIITRGTSNALGYALGQPCDTIPAPVALFNQALTANRPAVLGGSQLDVVFRGAISQDQRLFSTTYTSSWSAAVTLGNFLSILPPAATRVGTDVHVLFTGTDANVYDGLVDHSGGAATPVTGATSNAEPSVVTTDTGTEVVVWQGQDTNLYWSARPMSGSYGAPASLCVGLTSCLIATERAPVLSLDASGSPVVAWVGKGDATAFTSKLDLGASQWSSPLSISSEPVAEVPALATGVGSDDLEVVYIRASDGQGRHVQQVSGVYSMPVSLPADALATQPSLVRVDTP